MNVESQVGSLAAIIAFLWVCSDTIALSNRIAIPYPSWRFKKDIILLPNVLDKLEQINGVYYNWKVEEFPEHNFDNTRQIGVIAQELEQVYPELVVTDAKGFKTVDYPKLTAILIEAVKQQQAENEKLKSDVEMIKSMLNLSDQAEK